MSFMVVSAFPGCGKSTFVKSFPQVGDSDSSKFDKEYFPGNYMCHVRNNIVSDKCTLVSSHDIVRQALQRNNIDYILVYPALECKEEYIKRYRERGSELKFIDLLERNWESWIKDCQAQEGCLHIELKPGQYLADVISFDPHTKEFDVIRPEPEDYPVSRRVQHQRQTAAEEYRLAIEELEASLKAIQAPIHAYHHVSIESIDDMVKKMKDWWKMMVDKLKTIWDKLRDLLAAGIDKGKATYTKAKKTVERMKTGGYNEVEVDAQLVRDLFPQGAQTLKLDSIPQMLGKYLEARHNQLNVYLKMLRDYVNTLDTKRGEEDLENTLRQMVEEFITTQLKRPLVEDSDLLCGFSNPDFKPLHAKADAKLIDRIEMIADFLTLKRSDKTVDEGEATDKVLITIQELENAANGIYATDSDSYKADSEELTRISREIYTKMTNLDDLYTDAGLTAERIHLMGNLLSSTFALNRNFQAAQSDILGYRSNVRIAYERIVNEVAAGVNGEEDI